MDERPSSAASRCSSDLGRLGALLLIVTLIPLTFVMLQFWAERDPGARQTELAMFMKNLALIGGCVLLFSWFARDTFGFGLR